MAAAPAAPGKLVNEYKMRQARTPKPCFVCYKNSPYVLVSVSIPTLDFFYICASHVHDRAFATCTRPAPTVPTAQEQVEGSECNNADSTETPDSSNVSARSSPERAAPVTQSLSDGAIPLHACFALHREFFGRRARLFQPRRAELPKFPTVPGGAI